MDHRRVDALARSLARRVPRRGFLASAGIAATASVPGVVVAQTPAAGGGVSLPCQPCNCVGDRCDCCLVGVTGGGVVRTARGDVSFVLFATKLAAGGAQDAAGFVRWIDPNTDGGLTLESTGPVTYVTDTGTAREREIRGLMTVSDGQQPFALRLLDAGGAAPGQDRVGLLVGDSVSVDGATASGFGYTADGPLVGGDIQLLGEVAPVAPGA